MKQFKIIAVCVVLLPLFTSYQTMGRERYRIVVKEMEGKLRYIPQTKKPQRLTVVFQGMTVILNDNYFDI